VTGRGWSARTAVAATVACVLVAGGLAVGIVGAVESGGLAASVAPDGVTVEGATAIGQVRTDGDRGGTADGDRSALTVVPTGGSDLRYEVVIEGAAWGTAADGYAANRRDTVRYTGDGGAVVVGVAEPGSGDAFAVDGDIVELRLFDADADYRIELDDADVTDSVPTVVVGGDGAADGGSDAPTPEDEPEEQDGSDEQPATATPDGDGDGASEGADGAAAAANDTGSPSEADAAGSRIDSCTVIDEPGRYEVSDDVDAADTDVCLHVRASDVVLDGNGNTLSGVGAADSIGVLVLNASGASGEVGDPLKNVTVRDLRVTGWDTGVQAGSLGGTGTSLVLEDVDASGNVHMGVSFDEVDDSEMRDVTADDNRFGVVLWETYDIAVDGLVVEGNDRTGLALAQNVGDSTFTDVRAVGNGNDGGAGVRLSTDAENNVIADSVVADNDGPGIVFSDSFENAVRDTAIERNDGPGVVGVYPSGDRLEDVTLRENGDAQLRVENGDLDATGVAVGDGIALAAPATGSRDDGAFEVDTVDADVLSGDPPGTPATDEALATAGPPVEATVSFRLDDTADADAVELWRYDDGWTRVADGAVADGELTATVSTGGVLVPLAVDDAGTPEDGETTATENGETTATEGESNASEETETSEGTGTPGGTETAEGTETPEGTSTPGDAETSAGTTTPTATETPEGS